MHNLQKKVRHPTEKTATPIFYSLSYPHMVPTLRVVPNIRVLQASLL
jgi:hypothetical protein